MRDRVAFLARLGRNAVVAGAIGHRAGAAGCAASVTRRFAATQSRQSADMDWRHVRGRTPGLEGLSGRIALDVGDKPIGALEIGSHGATSVVADTGGAAATFAAHAVRRGVGGSRPALRPVRSCQGDGIPLRLRHGSPCRQPGQGRRYTSDRDRLFLRCAGAGGAIWSTACGRRAGLAGAVTRAFHRRGRHADVAVPH